MMQSALTKPHAGKPQWGPANYPVTKLYFMQNYRYLNEI